MNLKVAKVCKGRTICRAMSFMLIAFALYASPARVTAQEQPPQKPIDPSTSDELVDGLLDLLNDSTTGKATETPTNPPLTPADVGLDGEDLGEASENPLLAVRQSMLIAAGYLRREGAITETMKLQSDIVRRLDDLIAEMEKSDNKASNSKQDSQQQASARSKAQEQTQQTRSQNAKSRSENRQDAEGEKERTDRQGDPENQPTQQGNGGTVAVELSDPKSLQQDVWGQLPARVRQQMQSRMVEQFLPAYKEQIEAYFQALLK